MNILNLSPERAPNQIADDITSISRRAQERYLRDWELNLEQISGYIEGQTRALLKRISCTANDDGSQPEVVILNTIIAFVDRFISSALHLMDGFQVLPATDEAADRARAVAWERFLNWLWESGELYRPCMIAIRHMLATGKGFVVVEPFGQELRIWNPLPGCVHVHPAVTSLRDSPWVMIEDYMPAEYFEKRYNMPPSEADQVAPYSSTIAQLAGAEHDVVRVRKLWIAPNNRSPRGEAYHITKNRVIWEGQLDGAPWMGTFSTAGESPATARNPYPIAEFSDVPSQDGFWSWGRHTAARPLVNTASAVWRQMVAVASTIGIGVGISEASRIGAEELRTGPIWVVRYDAVGGAPHFWSVPQMAHHAYILERAFRGIEEIYSQHAATRGEAPGPRFPFAGLATLKQADIEARSALGRQVLGAISTLGYIILGEGIQVYSGPKLAAILGEENIWRQEQIVLGSLEPGWDVYVRPGTPGSEDRNTLRADAIQAAKAGLIDPQEFRRIVSWPSKTDMLRPTRHQEAIAETEEATFEQLRDEVLQGAPPPVLMPNWYDDHMFHVSYHRKRAAERHDTASNAENMARMAHVQQHMLVMAREAQAATQPAMPPPGAAPGAVGTQNPEPEMAQERNGPPWPIGFNQQLNAPAPSEDMQRLMEA